MRLYELREQKRGGPDGNLSFSKQRKRRLFNLALYLGSRGEKRLPEVSLN